jgi:ribosomal-protein-alanine N-acetyltransferase
MLAQTSRLSISQLTAGDTEFILSLLNTAGWIQYIGDRNVHTNSDALGYLKNGTFKSYKNVGYGLYLVKIQSSLEPIGICGLLKRDFLDTPDLGFAFLPQFEGKGYGFEAAQAILKHDRLTYSLSTIKAITQPNNHKSIKLLVKLGFQFESNIAEPSGNELLLYTSG